METTTSKHLTREDAQEVLHKLTILCENEDGQQDYGITQAQADELAHSVPANGGEWLVPSWAESIVLDEMADHCEVLADIASDARSGGERGQALRISKQAKRLREMFA